MIIKMFDRGKPGCGFKVPLVCDDEGNALPGQQHTTLESPARGAQTLTVVFQIDGKRVRFE